MCSSLFFVSGAVLHLQGASGPEGVGVGTAAGREATFRDPIIATRVCFQNVVQFSQFTLLAWDSSTIPTSRSKATCKRNGKRWADQTCEAK